MTKMRFTNHQTAFEYALYMITSSYFKKAQCTTPYVEKQFLVQYKEQKLDNQYFMEELCIQYMDELAEKLPARFFDQEMEVRLIRRGEGEFTEVLLKNAQYVIRFLCKYAGKKSQICHEIWRKR